MEDDKGLDLSLGLPCGRATDSVKGKSASASDELDRDSKLINDFKNFLEGGPVKHDASLGTQRSDPAKKEENFFNNLSNAPVDADTSRSLSSGGLRTANDSRSVEVEGENRPDVGDKRKSTFGDLSQQKKREREAHHSDLQDKARASHISITTDEGSTAENEDVADSDVVGSTSRLNSQHDDGSKRHAGSGGPSEIHKELHQVADSSSVELAGQRRFTITTEKELKFGGMSSGLPFSTQSSVNIMSMPYSLPMKDTNTSSTPSASSYQLPGMMQVMATTNSGRPGSQPVMPANLPLMFGYSNVQLPTLDKDNSPSLISHQQQLHPPYAGRGQGSSDKRNDVLKITQASGQGLSHKSSESTQYEGRGVDHVKTNGRHNISGEGSSSRLEDDERANNMTFRPSPSEQPRTDGLPSDYPAIRPGIAAELKFGGCGSYPNLPWVSTTGPGPNGKTISGVTYRYSPTQIRIVCACHGSHMSPEEFVRHAGEGQPTPETSTSVA